MGGVFSSFLEAKEPDATMMFKFTADGKDTRIESKADANKCLAGNPSQDEYQPPFVFEDCSGSNTQLFSFQPLDASWSQPGTKWAAVIDPILGMSWVKQQ